MYYILYEGLKIESNEPVYCTLYSVHCTVYTIQCTVYSVHSLNLVGKNAVESSIIVAIMFAFIPNKYNLFIQTK